MAQENVNRGYVYVPWKWTSFLLTRPVSNSAPFNRNETAPILLCICPVSFERAILAQFRRKKHRNKGRKRFIVAINYEQHIFMIWEFVEFMHLTVWTSRSWIKQMIDEKGIPFWQWMKSNGRVEDLSEESSLSPALKTQLNKNEKMLAY